MARLESVKDMTKDPDMAWQLAIVCGAVAFLVVVAVAFRD